MSERSHPSLEIIPPPTRKRRVETYLWDTMDGSAEELVSTICDPNRPLARTTVLIPVAAEQEKAIIAQAMACYARQKDCEPFTVALLLNYRQGIDDDRMAKVAGAIDKAYQLQKLHKDRLDIRVAVQEYADPTIGKIRKDLWDATLFTALIEGAFDDETGEVIGINHDIDTEYIDPHYIKNVQDTYQRTQQRATKEAYTGILLPPYFTRVRHLQPHQTHPYTAQGVYWIDSAIDQVSEFTGYEEGLVLPFSFYAKKGGFLRDSKTYETRPFQANVGDIPTIGGTDMLTSPRRYIDRFPQHGFADIWQDGTFTDVDQCRESTGRDASFEELEHHVASMLDRHLNAYYLQPAIRSAFSTFIRPQAQSVHSDSEARRFIEQSQRILIGYIDIHLQVAWQSLTTMGLRHLIAKAKNELNVAEIVTKQTESIDHEVRDMNRLFWRNR